MERKNTVAGNLVYQRRSKGLSQKELSARSNIAVRTIQRIEKGETEPHLQTIKILAETLHVEMDDLLVLEDPREEALQKKWLLLIHSTPFLGFMVPLANIFIPLFLWIHKREDHRIYEEHGRKVVNFQMTVTLVFIAWMSLFLFGQHWSGENVPMFWFLVGIIPYVVMVMLINVFTAVTRQKSYYPLSIPFISRRRKGKGKPGKLVSILFFFVFMYSTPASGQEIQRLDGSIISTDSLKVKIEQLMSDARVPGLGFTLFNDNQQVFSETFGLRNLKEGQPLTANTNMYGASLSKAVFSVIVMKLVEEEVIDLDTPLESYLPKKIWKYEPLTRWHDDYSALRHDSLYHKITARMALAHTSGFPNWRFVEPDKKLKVKQEPGSRYLYSGEGMVFLQVVLEKITGKNLEEMAKEIVFMPLNMENSSYTWKPQFSDNFAYGHLKDGRVIQKDKDNEARGPSTLETTLSDYNKFLLAALHRKLLSRESWEEIFSPQIRIRSLRQFGPLSLKEGPFNDGIQLSYGLGWGWFKTPFGVAVFKEGRGSGFQHHSVLFPESKKGILIMTNSFNGGSIFKELLEVSLKDVYTPWEWENYIPYNEQ